MMKTRHSFNTLLLATVLSIFGITTADFVTCPSDCSGCPENGAYSVADNLYYCTKQTQCPCNQPNSGCPKLCLDCPQALYNKTDAGGGVELTYCTELLLNDSSSCSCISPTVMAPLKTGYVPGPGGVHLVQYQKKNPDVSDQTPDGAYHLDIRVFDSSVAPDGSKREPSLIGALYGVVAFGGQPVLVNNTTPWVFSVMSPKGAVDTDPLTCSFNGQSWNTDQQPQCSMGHDHVHGYDHGSRNGDCGFPIPAH